MLYSELAYEIAKKAHKDQKDKAGVAYIHHSETVASMMRTDIEKAVAYLHDVIEDTNITLDVLQKQGFSKDILNAVDAITKRKGEDYSDYLERVASNKIAKVVKLADMKHNSDLSRFENPSAVDIKRSEKYKLSIEKLHKIDN